MIQAKQAKAKNWDSASRVGALLAPIPAMATIYDEGTSRIASASDERTILVSKLERERDAYTGLLA